MTCVQDRGSILRDNTMALMLVYKDFAWAWKLVKLKPGTVCSDHFCECTRSGASTRSATLACAHSMLLRYLRNWDTQRLSVCAVSTEIKLKLKLK